MKKITLTLLGLVCALCCAFGLAACGGGGDNAEPNLLTEAEWKEQLNAVIDNPDYSFKQSHYDGDTSVTDTELYINKADRTYSQSYYEDESFSSSYLFKKDGIYYEAYKDSDDEHYSYGTRTHTAAEFAEIEDEEFLSGWNAIVKQTLILCRDKYSAFSKVGGMMYAENVAATINNPFTEKDMDVTVGKITLMFRDKELVNIGFEDIEGDELESKAEWTYVVGANMQSAINSVLLPQIKGARYKLTEVNGSSSAPDVTENEGKYIKWKDDGTLEGDISISGLNIADGTMTCGDNGIVITIGDYTLTGYCMRQDITTTMELTLAIAENNEITYTFTLNL